MDSRDSALRILRPKDDGGLSSANPVSGNEAPRLLNTFGGGLNTRKLDYSNMIIILLVELLSPVDTNISKVFKGCQ